MNRRYKKTVNEAKKERKKEGNKMKWENDNRQKHEYQLKYLASRDRTKIEQSVLAF